MGAKEDLDAAIVALQGTEQDVAALVSNLGSQIAALQAQIASGGVSDADVETAVAEIAATTASLTALLPTPPASGPVIDPASGLPLYVIADGSTPDLTAWTAVTDVTGPNGQVLYTFNADAVGQPPAGVGGPWTLFVGVPTPAS